MLTLDNITKAFDGLVAVDGVDLEVTPGKTTVLIGPSGCGKSTLLKLMIGLIRPDKGTVAFDGDALDQDNLRAVRRRMGYVIQDGGLFPHMTAEENITLMARYLDRPAKTIDARLEELCTLTHFADDRLARYPAELSGGQRQRVALMRALMLDPEVLLLDEPLGALDPMIRYELQGELRDIFKRLKKTVVMVTHDMAEATFFAHEAVLLKDGRVVQKGTPKQLLSNPENAFVKDFIGAQRGLADALQGG